jgi:hypothetical protein
VLEVSSRTDCEWLAAAEANPRVRRYGKSLDLRFPDVCPEVNEATLL